MTNRTVLLICPFFPPLDVVGVYRMYRLAKYLPRLGWNVHVLTVDRIFDGRQDPTLLESLPDGVEIWSARYVEPTIRGVKTQLAGLRGGPVPEPPDLTQAAIPSTGRTGMASKRLAHRAYSRLRQRWLQSPDRFWTWEGPAHRRALELVHDHDISIVVTTSPPWTGLRIGARLQREVGVRWVADFRDPPSYMHHLVQRPDAEVVKWKRIESMAVRTADAVTVASEGIGMILTDMHGPGSMRRWAAIPTGLDEELFERRTETAIPPFPYLLFPGRYTVEYGTEFLEIFARALQDERVRRTGIRLLVVGALAPNRAAIEPVVRDLGIEAFVELRDAVSQRELLGLLNCAKAGVLLDGSTARWWCLHAKQVEYMGARKPVIARVPRVSVARMHLEETGLGLVLDGDLDEAASRLVAFLLDDRQVGPIDLEACRRFTASGQALSFARLFESLLSNER